MKRLLSPLFLLTLATAGAAHLPAQAQNTPAAATKRAAQAPTPYGQRADAQQWAQEVAERNGLDLSWVQAQLAQARFLVQVPRLMTPPPKTSTTARDWADYRRRFIDPIRIKAGVRFWDSHADTLARAEAQFGVPAAMIVGIIGVETIYGQNMGNLRVLDSLATLAFDFPTAHPRAAERQRYFRGELEQFLLMMHQAGTATTGPRGSYAGAMGLGQFMPSSWAKWAVDFDGDGRIDLFNSQADAIGSVANYFKAHGWVTGQPVWYPALFNTDTLDLPTLLAPDILPSFTPAQMARLGVLPEDGMQHNGLLALIELKNGDAPPSYIVGTQNFYTITRYNWSSYYATAVHDLGQEVAAARSGGVPAIALPVMVPLTSPSSEPRTTSAP
ncbi:lytic murein transglycosylase B [Comamonas jiangduensis]|uniref:lytic murein transglycosylase B n=1 Tax=Comamonas jiangduensis TaxID=1194168 RepID=UPI001582F8E9|nr:lytic murein transglycosylase B [Comamonas jiangduensis]